MYNTPKKTVFLHLEIIYSGVAVFEYRGVLRPSWFVGETQSPPVTGDVWLDLSCEAECVLLKTSHLIKLCATQKGDRSQPAV